MMPPGGDLAKDRKAEQKVDMKKKTQAEIEQEMAALQYTNPMLLEVRRRRLAALLDACGVGEERRAAPRPSLMSLLVFAANEDGPDEPDELGREREPPSGPGPAILLRRCRRRGPASGPAGLCPEHATSTDVQQHGPRHGPWEHAASFHGPRADGAPLRSSTGDDGTPRHAGTSRYAETFWAPPEPGTTGASRHGPARAAGAPAFTRTRAKRCTGASSGGHDGTSGEHDATRSGGDDGAPEQDAWQHAK